MSRAVPWLTLLALSSGCGSPAEDSGALKVGVLLPFTGREGGPSHNFERAVLFARSHLSAVGVDGRPLEIVFADTHSDLKRGLAAADTLLAEGVVAIIGPESEELGTALLPRLRRESVLLITPGITSGAVQADASIPWFRIAPSTKAVAENLAKRLIELDVQELAILHGADTYNASFARSFDERFKQLGGAVLADWTLPENRQTYTDVVTLLAGRDRVLLATSPETAARVVNEAAVLPQVRQWYLTPALKTEVFVRNAAPAALRGALGVTPDITVDPGFAQGFARYWDGDSPLESALYYYDALALIALGYERARQSHDGTIAAPELAEGIFAVAFNSGIVVSWSELGAGAMDTRAGSRRYYRGLTGSIVFEPEGQRAFGRSKLWTISEQGEIVDER